MKQVNTEINALSKLGHDNIIKILDFGNGEYTKTNGKTKTVDYVVLEIAEKGELLNYMACSKGPFSEPIARYFTL